MEGFPTEFDLVIYGTGIPESIVSAAASLVGKSVLHIDRYQQYGSVSSSIRFLELLTLSQEPHTDDVSNPIFKTNHRFESIQQLHINWHIPEDKPTEELAQDSTTDPNNTGISRKSLLKHLSRFEVDIFPKILLSRSGMINAILQADVSRYLEFLFIRNIYTYIRNDNKIIHIPQNRNDVFESSMLTLIQKRRFTKFLQWCMQSDANDAIYKNNEHTLLSNYLTNELNMDVVLRDAVIHGLIIEHQDISFKEGVEKLKNFLNSVNRFGPFPMLVPQYGSSDISQGFCRMSAVFGSMFCLDCHVNDIKEVEPNSGSEHSISVDLSISHTVKTKHFVTNREYVQLSPAEQANIKWTSRGVFVNSKSIFHQMHESDEKYNGVSLLTIPMEGNAHAVVMETFIKSTSTISELYVVQVNCSNDHLITPEKVCEPIEKIIFTDNAVVSPHRLISIYFSVPDYTDCEVTTIASQLPPNVHVAPGVTRNWHLDEEVKQAEVIFQTIFPEDKFLAPPPKPEDIVYDDAISTDDTSNQ